MTRRRLRMPAMSLFACLLSLAVSPAAVQAAGDTKSFSKEDLLYDVDYRWAGAHHGGYYPIRIRLVNRGPSRNLTFRLVPGPISRRGIPVVERTVSADQNATVRFTLSVPMVAEGRMASLRVFDDGNELKSLETAIVLPDAAYDESAGPALLVVSDNLVDVRGFEEAVSNSSAAGYVTGMGTADFQVVPPATLPENWIDYSGLDLVAVDLKVLSKLDSEARSAILQWVQCGGTMFVYNVGQAADQSEELSRLLELERSSSASNGWRDAWKNFKPQPGDRPAQTGPAGRFLVTISPIPETNPSKSKRVTAHPGLVYRDWMFGRVYAFRDDPFPGSPNGWVDMLSLLGSGRFHWNRRLGVAPRGVNSDFMHFLIPGVGGVNAYAYLALITLFTVVIGPVNYFFLAKRKRLYLLLLTIPVIAFTTSLLLFGYSIVSEGFGVKSRMRSLTLLDQKNQTAVTINRVALYAGMAPSEGLTFSRETAVFPIWSSARQFEGGRVNWTETQNLRSGWLSSRTRTQFLTVANRRERGRLEISRSEEGRLNVANGFESDIEALIVADTDGKLYFGDNLQAGRSQYLFPATSKNTTAVTRLLRRHPVTASNRRIQFEPVYRSSPRRGKRMGYPGSRFGYTSSFATCLSEKRIDSFGKRLTNGKFITKKSYLAVFKDNPGVEAGLEKTDELDGWHVLVGYY